MGRPWRRHLKLSERSHGLLAVRVARLVEDLPSVVFADALCDLDAAALLELEHAVASRTLLLRRDREHNLSAATGAGLSTSSTTTPLGCVADVWRPKEDG